MPSYCPCCDENLNQPFERSDGAVTMNRYTLHVACCLHDPHSGVPMPAVNLISRCHRDYRKEVLNECERFEAKQNEHKQAGHAPKMTTTLWVRYMLGRLPIWMSKFPNLG